MIALCINIGILLWFMYAGFKGKNIRSMLPCLASSDEDPASISHDDEPDHEQAGAGTCSTVGDGSPVRVQMNALHTGESKEKVISTVFI